MYKTKKALSSHLIDNRGTAYAACIVLPGGWQPVVPRFLYEQEQGVDLHPGQPAAYF